MIVDRRCLLGLFAIGAADPSAAKAFAREGSDLPFKIDLPPGFVVKARPRGPDFDIYDVVKGNIVYVGVYLGGAASFPMNTAAKVAQGRAPNIQVATSVSGGPRREYLIKNRNGWGMLHVWTQDPPGDQVTAEKIAASIGFK
jgi:hypothetical protein